MGRNVWDFSEYPVDTINVAMNIYDIKVSYYNVHNKSKHHAPRKRKLILELDVVEMRGEINYEKQEETTTAHKKKSCDEES